MGAVDVVIKCYNPTDMHIVWHWLMSSGIVLAKTYKQGINGCSHVHYHQVQFNLLDLHHGPDIQLFEAATHGGCHKQSIGCFHLQEEGGYRTGACKGGWTEL